MRRASRAPGPERWRIRSVTAKARDAPRRLRAAYRLLLEAHPDPPESAAYTQAPLWPLEDRDAGRDLRPRLDRAAGTRADH